MSDTESIKVAAEARDLLVWHGYPEGLPAVDWPDEKDVVGFLDAALRMKSPVIYLDTVETDDPDTAGFVAGFASQGVMHRLLVGVSEGWDAAMSQSDLDDIVTWASSSEHEQRKLPDHLQAVVDALVNDPRYDAWEMGSLEIVSEYADGLPTKEFTTIKNAASDQFRNDVAPQLDADAQRLATRVLRAHGFDPLEALQPDFVAAATGATDERVIRRITRIVNGLAWEKGLRTQAEEEVERAASAILKRMPLPLRDQLGFCSRTTQRQSLLEQYLTEIPAQRHGRTASLVARLEYEQFGSSRERRYATAARVLWNRGMSKASVSRKLGVSTSVLDRLETSHKADVEIDTDDPLWIMLNAQ